MTQRSRIKASVFAFTLALLNIIFAGNAHATTFEYDDLGRITKATYDNGMVVDYAYDPAGNRTSKIISGGTPPPNPPDPLAGKIFITIPIGGSPATGYAVIPF